MIHLLVAKHYHAGRSVALIALPDAGRIYVLPYCRDVMGGLRGTGLVVIASIVHLILCYSVIDIHFQSPVVSGIPPVWPETKPHSKRIVLIVADGESITARPQCRNHQSNCCIF